MRIAILSDIHSNFDALQAVSQELSQQAIDEIICLGDVIGYGAQPQACIDWVEKNCVMCIKGNHEAMIGAEIDYLEISLDVVQAIRWTQKRIPENKKNWIKSWPLISSYQNILLTHGSPHQPEVFHYLRGQFAALNAFENFSNQLCLVGHTHVPAVIVEHQPGNLVWKKPINKFRLASDERYIVNVGSVGQPRNGNAKAQWTIVDQGRQELSFHAIDYPIKEAADKIIQAGLPVRFASRLEQGH